MRKRQRYLRLVAHGHPKADKAGQLAAHVVIAERALGRRLSDGNAIHHVNGIGRDNTPSNLVICEDNEYHTLLHMRARIVEAGGDPDTERLCYTCGDPKPLAMFYPEPDRPNRNVSGRCKPCQKSRDHIRNSITTVIAA